MNATITITLNQGVFDRAIHAADQLVYARQREWSGIITINRFNLRNLIADEMVKFHESEKQLAAARSAGGEGEP